jgi:hypothetical protein
LFLNQAKATAGLPVLPVVITYLRFPFRYPWRLILLSGSSFWTMNKGLS